MNQQIFVKQGATLQLACVYCDASGSPLTLAGITVRSQVREKLTRKLLSTLSYTLVNEGAGQFTLLGDSSGWPVATVEMDIIYTDGSSTVVPTDTVDVVVGERVTE